MSNVHQSSYFLPPKFNILSVRFPLLGWFVEKQDLFCHLSVAFVVMMPMVHPANLQIWSCRMLGVRWIWTSEIRSVLSILRVIDIQLVFVASKKAAAWRRGWFSGLLPDGLRAPRTGQDGHKCHEENQMQGGEKVGLFRLHTFLWGV